MNVLLISHQFPSPQIPYRGRFVEDQILVTKQMGVDFFVVQVDPVGFRLGNVQSFFVALWFGLVLGREVPIYIEGQVSGARLFSPGVRLGGGIQAIINAVIVARWMIGKDLSRYDCIHAHTGLSDGLIALFLSRILRKPHVVTEHTAPYEALFKGPGGRLITGAVAKRADAMVAVSSFLRNCINRYFGDAKVQVIGNAYDATTFVPTRQPPERASPVIAWIGHVSPRKRLSLAILSLRELRSSGVNASLKVLTSSDLDDESKQVIEQYALHEHVFVVGAETRERVASELRESSALLVTSEVETFSVTTLEALATGIPVVSTNCGGPADLLTHPFDGELDSQGTPESLAGALVRVLSKDSITERSARAARAYERFGPRAVGEAYLQVYRRLLKPDG